MRLEELEDTKSESIQELRTLRISTPSEEMEGVNNIDDTYDFDDVDDDELVPVTLGFVEKPRNSWCLFRQLFPSKAGGVPAWLDPVNLPTGRCCLCDMCGEPLQFLLQVYAPIAEKESTFHRTLFVFMCPSMTCLLRDQHEQWKRGPQKPSRSVKVFRCQLAHTNAFYPSEPPKYDGSDKPLSIGAPLCVWCGTWKGDKTCSSCRRANYCSEKHQVLHWRADHKQKCKKLSVSLKSDGSHIEDASPNQMLKGTVACKTLWPEFEITIEDESEFSTVENSESMVTRQQMDELIDNAEGWNQPSQSEQVDDDRQSWATFQERIAKAPEQVLRYSRDERAKPLWPTSSGRPSKADVPKCSSCGGAMNFEFQILPQLLYYFGVNNDINSLDWATIVVYACVDSCEGSQPYKEEFAWVQLISQSSVP